MHIFDVLLCDPTCLIFAFLLSDLPNDNRKSTLHSFGSVYQIRITNSFQEPWYKFHLRIYLDNPRDCYSFYFWIDECILKNDYVIDFLCPLSRAFDVGNHFNEWCFDNLAPEWPGYAYYAQDFPTKEEQVCLDLNFIPIDSFVMLSCFIILLVFRWKLVWIWMFMSRKYLCSYILA